MTPGPRNLITDVAGLAVGNAQDDDLKSGTTVLLSEDGPMTTSYAVMGGMIAATVVGTLMIPFFFMLMQSMRERFKGENKTT